MTQLSPTALEAAATKLDPNAFAVDEFGCYALVSASSRRASARTHATAAITAYLAQMEKEGWVMVPKIILDAQATSTTPVLAEFIDARSSAEPGVSDGMVYWRR